MLRALRACSRSVAVKSRIRTAPPHSVPAAALVFFSFIAFASPGAAGQQPAAPSASPPPAAASGYAGSQVCQGCHEDLFKALEKSPHVAVETGKKRGWEGKACEACHGPGAKHAESGNPADIANPAKLKPAETDTLCLKCHLNTPAHASHTRDSHAHNDVSCTACHAIHKNGPNGLVPRTHAATNTLCASCHTAEWASFQRPYKHRLPEGAMDCTDCHDPHGSLRPGMLRMTAGNERSCVKCHAEVRGPFTFEHAPVRLEGCDTCHQPHGSANPRMLVRHEVRFVCLECHAALPAPNPSAMGAVPPAFHDLRSPRFQNCTICHQKIHGSHVDRNFLR
jgi:DmsE family decaheme c-type cytochrome